MEKITSLPGGGLTAVTAVQAENSNAHPRSTWFRTGITPERDNPAIFVTLTLLGEEKLSVPNAPQLCCVAVSCPWLIAAPVERASACNAEQQTISTPD